ncbi:MAG: O-antigen ligase family protein [Patescibacteria group bacterium]|nr:O-antigen ligase family protein [Patescibacteria group bacterium]
MFFLPTQFGKHFWPNFSYVYGIRIDYLSPTLYFTDILMVALILVWILESLLSVNSLLQVIRKTRRNIDKLLMLFFLALFLLVGIFRSDNPSAGIYGLVKFLEYVLLFFYTAKNFRKLNGGILLSIFIAGILFESSLTIAQYLNQGSIGKALYLLGERSFNSQTPGIANASINGELFLRPYATFSHPNVLAGYLLVFMTLIIFYSKQKFFEHQNVFVYFSLALGTLALFLTMSRVSIFAWSAAVLFFLAHSFWKKTRMVSTKKTYSHPIKNKIFLLLFLIITLFIFTFPIGLRLFQFSFSEQSVTQRETLIKDSVIMFQKNPVFGVGLNNFLISLPAMQKQYKEDLYIQPVHNIYLLILAETGAVGLTIFLYFLWNTYKRLKKNTNVELLALFSLILSLGFFDHYFLTLQQGQLLIVIISGLFWSIPKRQQAKNDNIKT